MRTLEAVAADLESPDAGVRRAAAAELVEAAGQHRPVRNVGVALHRALSDADPIVRRGAATALLTAGIGPTWAKMLRPAFEAAPEEPLVRAAWATGDAARTWEVLVPVLIAATSVPEARRAALGALGEAARAGAAVGSAVPSAVRCLHGDDEEASAAIGALRMLHAHGHDVSGATPALREALERRGDPAALLAADVLARLGADPELLLGHARPAVREGAAQGFRQARNVRALARLLADPWAACRWHAVHGLDEASEAGVDVTDAIPAMERPEAGLPYDEDGWTLGWGPTTGEERIDDHRPGAHLALVAARARLNAGRFDEVAAILAAGGPRALAARQAVRAFAEANPALRDRALALLPKL